VFKISRVAPYTLTTVRQIFLDFSTRPTLPCGLPWLTRCFPGSGAQKTSRGVERVRGDVLWLVDDDLVFDDHTLFILRLYHMLLADARPVIVPHYADRQEPWSVDLTSKHKQIRDRLHINAWELARYTKNDNLVEHQEDGLVERHYTKVDCCQNHPRYSIL
jgi:hypothetical protein